MAHVEDRWEKRLPDGRRVRTSLHGKGKRWKARYIGPDGRERAKSFDRKGDADRFVLTVEGDKLAGRYVDPRDGRTKFRDYAERWRGTAVHEPSTAMLYERLLRLHVFPMWGERGLGTLKHTDARALVASLSKSLAPNTARQVHALVRTICRSAVDDRLLVESPFARLKLPRVEVDRTIVPPSIEEVRRLLDAASDDLRPLLHFAALTGCRSGELLGLRLEDVDFLRRELHVRQQLNYLPGHGVYIAEPKTPESLRTVPLPKLAVDVLAAHLAARPAEPVNLPRGDVDGRSEPVRLVFQRRNGGPILRTTLDGRFRHAVRSAGLSDRKLTPHSLRKHYATVLANDGLPERIIAAWLGHAPTSVTARVYALVDANAAARTRETLDRLWQASDGLTTAYGTAYGL